MRNVVNEDFLSHCATSGKRITVLCALLERRADKPREELSLSAQRVPPFIYIFSLWMV
jgi:hypothetical protein